MAVTWVSIGTTGASTTAASPVYPAVVTAGEALFLITINKATTGTGDPPVIGAVTGWTELFTVPGGTGTAAVGTGRTRVTYHRRDTNADGTEDGTTATSLVANPANSSFVMCAIFSVAFAGGTTLGIAGAGGEDTSSGTAYSATMSTDPGITNGDLLIAGLGWDLGVSSGGSAEGISATSATIGTVTERLDASTTSGHDCRAILSSASCTAGTASAAAVLTATSAGSVAGAGALLRIREVAAATTSLADTTRRRYLTPLLVR